jgi:hypothetical protein
MKNFIQVLEQSCLNVYYGNKKLKQYNTYSIVIIATTTTTTATATANAATATSKKVGTKYSVENGKTLLTALFATAGYISDTVVQKLKTIYICGKVKINK